VMGVTDELALERLASIPEVAASVSPSRIDAKHAVKRLWDVCQIPDFRNVTIDAHVRLLQDIYRLLVNHGGKLPDDFMEKHVIRLDDTSGSVDILSQRLAQIRTWTYCANKTSWMYQPGYWIDRTREVEDRLSDALHEGLIARFVDRRTSALLKGIGTGTTMETSVKDNGEVWVDGHLIGRLEGLTFIPDESGSDVEAKALLATAAKAIGPEIDRRLTSLSGGTHAIFTLSHTGQILWGGKPIGRIAPSGTVFNPDAELIGGQLGNPNLQAMATSRMRDFLKAEVTAKLAPLEALKALSNSETALPEAKGFAFTLLEGFGSLDRMKHGKVVKELSQDMRKQLREVGVFFGQYHVFMREMLKPKPATLLSLLVAYGAGGDKKPFIPFAGVTSIANEGDLASTNYSEEALALMGFKAAGPRTIRFDILDRLSGLIRQAQNEGGARKFQVMQEMLALLGSNYEDVRGVLTALGYKSETVEPKPAEEKAIAETAAPAVETAPAAPAETKSETPTAETDAPTPPAATPKPKSAPKLLQVYIPREENAEGKTVELENNEFWTMPFRQNTKPRRNNSNGSNNRDGNKTQNPGYKGKRKGGPKTGSGYKKAERPDARPAKAKEHIKPEDSPVAALLALKNKKD